MRLPSVSLRDGLGLFRGLRLHLISARGSDRVAGQWLQSWLSLPFVVSFADAQKRLFTLE